MKTGTNLGRNMSGVTAFEELLQNQHHLEKRFPVAFVKLRKCFEADVQSHLRILAMTMVRHSGAKQDIKPATAAIDLDASFEPVREFLKENEVAIKNSSTFTALSASLTVPSVLTALPLVLVLKIAEFFWKGMYQDLVLINTDGVSTHFLNNFALIHFITSQFELEFETPNKEKRFVSLRVPLWPSLCSQRGGKMIVDWQHFVTWQYWESCTEIWAPIEVLLFSPLPFLACNIISI